jgi:DNA-binding transcriptional MerR regulator
MRPSTLTIGELAAHVGVTVRAVRHYHHRGLLAEPARDASGYRRYDASAVVDLIRIKTLADAGVPLARIHGLLSAGPGEFAEAITQIDESLKKRIRELTDHRRRIAELAGGERLFLPAEIVDILGQLRALGVSERTVRIERDAWILAAALSPEVIPEWASVKRAALGDPEFRQLYLACDGAFDWDPADPRLEKLADEMVAWVSQSRPDHGQPPPDSPVVALMSAQIASSSPAWQRLRELAEDPRRAGARESVPPTWRSR